MWHVYIISCSDNSLYTGITTDIFRRIKEHNSGKGGHYTVARLPVKLVYQEKHPDRSCALRREAEIKRLTRSEKIAIIKNIPN